MDEGSEADDDSTGMRPEKRRKLPLPPPPVPGRIAVVGPCAAGKTTLVDALAALGYDVRHVAQEHSGVPDMWQRIARPECLIFLDASLATIQRRRAIAHIASYLDRERARLAHARAHCQIYLHTDALSAHQVLERVIVELSKQDIEP